MTAVDPETRIPDPIDVDAAEEARLRAAAGLGPPASPPGSEYAGFELVGVPDRPPLASFLTQHAIRSRDAVTSGVLRASK